MDNFSTYMDETHHDAHLSPPEFRGPTQESVNDTSVPESADGSENPQKPAKTSSHIWLFYDKLADPQVPNHYWCVCKLCPPAKKQKQFSFYRGGGTGTLTRHLEGAHGITKQNYKEGASSSRQGPRQTQLGAGFTTGQPGGGMFFQYDRNRMIDGFAQYCSITESPFQMGECPQFETFVQQHLCPSYAKVGRKVLKRRCVAQYQNGKLQLQELFSKREGRYCITSDIWTSPIGESYICVTVHWIDDAWVIQKRVIGFEYIPERHTGHAIYDRIADVLREFNIFEKIFSISLDNAAANTKCIDFMKRHMNLLLHGEICHVRCVAHIVNLTVQEVCKDLSDLLTPIRDCIKWLRGTGAVKREYKEMCRQAGLPARLWSMDTPTRWNSTYEMLEPACRYRVILSTIYEKYYRGDDGPGYISPESWATAEKVCDFLKAFKEVTLTFSKTYSPNIHEVIVNACSVADALLDASSDFRLVPYIEKMKRKWLDYFTQFPVIYLVAVLLDPNCKKEGLDNLLAFYYDALQQSHDWSSDVNTAVSILVQLYEIYARELNIELPSHTQSSTSTSTRVGKLLDKIVKKSKQTSCSSSSIRTPYSIVIDWLATPHQIDSDGYDILTWWRRNNEQYPVLAAIARDILAIPASTIASESTFSAGRRLITDRRTRLNPETIKTLICKRDWDRADKRTQEEHEILRFNINDDSDEDGTTSTYTDTPVEVSEHSD